MAYQNNGYQRGGYQGNYGNRPTSQGSVAQAPEIKPLPVPDDYVTAAENFMNQYMHENGNKITTTKIRSFLALIDEIYNVENLRTEKTLSSESKLKIMRLRVRVVYDAGRDKDVKNFVTQAKLVEYLKGIGDSREDAIKFAHYMEALVAYHRYWGGKEN